jgi:heat shock protein HslJ
MKLFTMSVFCAAFAALAAGIAGAQDAREMGGNAAELKGTEWLLQEFSADEQTVKMDRAALTADNFDGVFSLSFGDVASGMGAPNRFTGPYTAGNDGAMSIGGEAKALAATRMAAFREPPGLNEDQYFKYLTGATGWTIREEKLVIYSASGENEVVLTFEKK